jgi:hypothetical protein
LISFPTTIDESLDAREVRNFQKSMMVALSHQNGYIQAASVRAFLVSAARFAFTRI